jgi:hypothetical protein
MTSRDKEYRLVRTGYKILLGTVFPVPSMLTNVSEEPVASIFRVEELLPALRLVSCLAYSSTLKMVSDVLSKRRLAFTRHYIQDRPLRNNRALHLHHLRPIHET